MRRKRNLHPLAFSILLGASAPKGSLAAVAEPPTRFGHIEKMGSSGPVLLLVPCLGCDWRSWDQFMARNAHRYRMYAVTWPGMGDTQLPDVRRDPTGTPLWDYLLDAMSDVLLQETDGDAVLVGHSAAGPVVVQFGYRFPERVAGLITVDATITNWDTFGFFREQRLRWAEGEMNEVLRQYDSDEAWRKLNASPTMADAACAAFYGQMWMLPPRQNVLRYWAEWLRADSGALIPSLKVPLLAMYALSSGDPGPAKTRAELLARFERASAPPHVTVEFVADSGHFIWEFQPERFDRLVSEFVTRIVEADMTRP